jgi:hypothetical protein
MSRFFKFALLMLASGGLAVPQHPAIAILPGLQPAIVRVETHSCGSPDRIATGFLWRNSSTAVTALHAVAGCTNVGVYFEMQKVARSATVMRVLNRADLALLQINNPPTAPTLAVDPRPPSLNDDLATIGYQLQIPSMSSSSLQLRVGGSRLRDIVNPAVAQEISLAGSPSLDLEITNIEGHLVHGLSGAPVLNQRGNVVAIADGGLENGTVGISWAIPSKFLDSLAGSTDNVRSAQPNASGKSLFAADIEATNKGQTMCGALPLTRLRTVSFNRIMASADDPLGLQQIVGSFNVDPSGFNFDIYQQLLSGATVVVPAGARLITSNGQCRVLMDRGNIVMEIEVSHMNSLYETQARSLVYENSIAGSNPEFWVTDAQWTYLMPTPRFDGLVVRRKAFRHFQASVTGPRQDRYLFETLAVRGNTFLGSSAMNTYDWTAIMQSFAPCYTYPNAPGCAEIVNLARAWAQAVLSVHLSTFPIG